MFEGVLNTPLKDKCKVYKKNSRHRYVKCNLRFDMRFEYFNDIS